MKLCLRTAIPCLLFALAIAACQKADDSKSKGKDTEQATAVAKAAPGDTPTHAAPGSTEPAAEAKGKGSSCDCGKDECDHDHGEGEGDHSCSGDSTRLTNDEVVERKDDQGRTVLHAGKNFTNAPVVTVAELRAKTDDYIGKTVQVEGDVSAMCHHKRGWFAIVAKDKSGQDLRIMTAPVFLVPPDSIGKAARAEGVIDVIEVNPKMAEHLAKEHKMDKPAAKDGVVRQVIMRATGADFI